MQELNAPIERVIVAEDRAFIRRRGRLQLEPGAGRCCLAGVSPVIVDKSLAVQLQGSARLISTQVVRQRSDPPPAPGREPTPAERDIGQADLIEAEMRAADALYIELLVVIAEQAAWGQADPEQWDEQLQEIMSWKAELERRRFELERPAPVVPLVFPEINPLVTRAEVLIDLDAQTAGEVELTLEYCVPLAAWRPYHQAEFLGDRVHFSAQGCVWQNTGEDWNEVELVLSTERQSLGAVPPPVPREFLNTRKRSGEIVVQQRDLAVEELSSGTTLEVPGIDDGGQVFSAPVTGRCTVSSDGYAVRIPLFEFQCSTRMENLLAAEICPQVAQRTRLSNPTAWPLLAGPVDMLREAGWVGRCRIGLVAPGEGFELSWGAQTHLRATRHEQESPAEKEDLLGGWIRQRTQTTIILSNLSAQTQSLEVIERVPISEIKQVEISVDMKTMQPPARPDQKGFLRWKLELGPRSKTVIETAYWTRRRKEVVGV